MTLGPTGKCEKCGALYHHNPFEPHKCHEPNFLAEAQLTTETHMNGIESIAAERKRQIEAEGWTLEHDDQHTDESLALVAALYATPCPLFSQELGENYALFEDPWPTTWDENYDKREEHDRRRRLVIAGALIAADIDRIDRAAAQSR